MGIPDAILQKPDVLSDSEWTIMQTHPELAHQLLSKIDFLAPAMDIPYCHHEKWDGTGYPRKLKGKDIPLAACIFAVVDVFDALTTDRPYRKAWSREDALAYIREQSGKHFFPEAVNAFLEMLGE
jgi:HD-GYP domain-containing protein (c-di-GMP phosphodiesterase class II)